MTSTEHVPASPTPSAEAGAERVTEEMVEAGTRAYTDRWIAWAVEREIPKSTAETMLSEPIQAQTRGAIRAALEAALSVTPAPQASGRLPIESAPKDGTPILITRPTRFPAEEGWHVVRWDDGDLGPWWQVHDGKRDHPLRGADPTHWQPLPPAPPVSETEPRR